MFKIKIEELQVLLNYLQKKPFIETASLIAMIQKLDKIEDKKEENKKEDKPKKVIM